MKTRAWWTSPTLILNLSVRLDLGVFGTKGLEPGLESALLKLRRHLPGLVLLSGDIVCAQVTSLLGRFLASVELRLGAKIGSAIMMP